MTMQDRFKFRVWLNKSKRYTINKDDIVLFHDGAVGQFDIIGCYDEKDVTVEFCTGLKDKNGKLIYEGDIVKDTIIDCGVIQWNEYHACFMVVFGDGDNREFGEWDTSDFEVIGNINENIDLLENKDE